MSIADNSWGNIEEPMPGTVGDNEMDTNADTNADTCCLGPNFVILNHTQRIAEVYAYDETLPVTTVPIVSGATAYTCPITHVTYLLVFNEGLYYGKRLNHSLINPNQVRMNKVPLWDNPFDAERIMGIDLADTFVPFQTQGTKIFFRTQAPTQDEIDNCHQINVTSKNLWNPKKVQLHISEVRTDNESVRDDEDPRSNEQELKSIDPTLIPSTWRLIEQVQTYDQRTLDVPMQSTFQSSERCPIVTPEILSERWGISTDQARA